MRRGVENKILFSAKDLCTWFELRRWGFFRVGSVKAVDGVSFELRRGETITIVGESGCGKSTLAKTILGLCLPARGELNFDGKRLNGLNTRQMRSHRSKIGYIQQDPYGALPPFMTVRRILEEPLRINKTGKKEEMKRRVREVLTEVKLTPVEDFIDKFPHMLSGGQQQRVVIARSIVMKPRLIVADEPISMLDASVRIEILELIRGLQHAHNLGVIYITHDLSTVRHFSEHIAVMYGAKFAEKAKVKDILDNPLHPYTRALLSAVPKLDPANVTTFKEVPPGEPPSLLKPPSGCRFHPRCYAIIKGLCDVESPLEFEAKKGHSVACWLYRK